MNQTWLTLFAVLASGGCCLGLLFKLMRLLRLGWKPQIPPSVKLFDAPKPLAWHTALRKVLISPAGHFHRHACRSWTWGYALYHSAILMVVSGYALSFGILLVKIATHAPILDFATHSLVAGPTTISNLLALIFGNAEHMPSVFLFGTWAPWLSALAWCELPLAVAGNACLLYTLLHGRMGAVRHDLDVAVQDLRLRGEFSGQHLLVRLVIFTIIGMEFMGRFNLIPGIAYAHAWMGMLLIALFPFTYLVHIPLAPLALGLAIWRRRQHAIA
jgi:hypothetical protein